jgi:DNA modification methylase
MIIDSLKNLAVPIENLQALPGNPRLGDVDAVAKSLQRFGQRKPIVARKDDGVIIAGNHTWQAAKKLGWTEIAVAFVGDDDVTAKAYALADNRTAELGSYDEQALIDLIEEVHAVVPEFVRDAGWSEEAVKELVAKIESEQPLKEIDEDEIPEPPVEPVTKLGDIWQLGRHRLMCGDSTDEIQVTKLMNGETADMIFTDPPYGFNYIKKSDGLSIKNDGKEFEIIIKMALKNIKVKTYFICGDAKTSRAFLRATENLGEPKTIIVWVKPIQHRMHKFEPCHEFIYFWGLNGNPFYGENVFQSKRAIEKYHPTVKPIELIVYCLKSTEANLVVDLFGGSGSTLIATEQINRKCYMMELEPKYCDVIIKRWENLTGEKAVLVSNAESPQA